MRASEHWAQKNRNFVVIGGACALFLDLGLLGACAESESPSRVASAGTSASASASSSPAASVAAPSASAPQPLPHAWQNRGLSADDRAQALVHELTRAEKLTIVTGYFGVQKEWNEYRFPEARAQSAGFVPGVARVGFTPQWQSDAGSGVATQGEAPAELERTVLPSGLLTACTFDPALAERAGAMIGSEARASGFNVLLAGGVDLLRDPGNGRNFEYGGEDPLLAGSMVGAIVRGIQSNHIVSTVKHFAFNDQETGRGIVNVVVDEAAARSSDLLAFQFAIELGNPGSVMCSYNKINGTYACQNEWLLSQVLKEDWGYRGYVMTDWHAQHDTVQNALAGLDQETGVSHLGQYQWLDKLSHAIDGGAVPEARLDDMVRRIARTLIEKGAVDEPVAPAAIDFAAHAEVTRADAENGITLLKNEGILPLKSELKRIAVIGGHADAGVLTGGGSAQVYARGGNAVRGLGLTHWPGPEVYAPSSPLVALRAELPSADITWDPGTDPKSAAEAAAKADVAIVFATQWTAEAMDFSLTLPDGQDKLIEAVTSANKHTVVVLETGGAVLLPWLARVPALVEAWYPGSEGGKAIARVLSGAVNPSGHLALSFPRALTQLPRPKIVGDGLPKDQPFDVHYDEGAAVGYRYYDAKHLEPALPFGAGLSYTKFTRGGLSAKLEGAELRVSFHVQNTGARAGKDVALVFVSPVAGGWEAPKRLGAFAKRELSPSASADVSLTVDPRLLATFDVKAHAFRIAKGTYRVTLASTARDPGQSVTIALPERTLPAGAGAH